MTTQEIDDEVGRLLRMACDQIGVRWINLSVHRNSDCYWVATANDVKAMGLHQSLKSIETHVRKSREAIAIASGAIAARDEQVRLAILEAGW